MNKFGVGAIVALVAAGALFGGGYYEGQKGKTVTVAAQPLSTTVSLPVEGKGLSIQIVTSCYTDHNLYYSVAITGTTKAGAPYQVATDNSRNYKHGTVKAGQLLTYQIPFRKEVDKTLVVVLGGTGTKQVHVVNKTEPTHC